MWYAFLLPGIFSVFLRPYMGEFNQKKYNNEYNKKNYDNLLIRLPKGTKEEWKKIAEEQGQSLNAFVIDAVNTKLRDLWII